MKIFFLILVTFALTACSKPHDKYLGYWQLEDTKYPKILSIYKEDKETYLVNENILAEKDFFGNKKTGTVLEKKDKELGVNNGLTVIPFTLSSDGSTLRITNSKYIRITEAEAQTALKNKKACSDLRTQYLEESKSFNLFAKGAEKTEQDQIKTRFLDMQKQIPDCQFHIGQAF
ncbi:hypothetical protein [Acinetobacter sp. ESBL14]|uniref:hypothetical protein n=1 Tax=Acinetobacter sp. ESBL14 TaxID=3077329 RepID=UPI002FC9F20F